MRLLILTVPFFPSVGGVETVAALLAREWTRLGHEVCVITPTPNDCADVFPYRVVRHPSLATLLSFWRWADVIFLQGLSLRLGWPAFIVRTPLVLTHHMILGRSSYSGWWRPRLLRRAKNVAVSRAVAESLPVSSEVIFNPYDAEVFNNSHRTQRRYDLAFVGRLCGGKGVHLLLQSLMRLSAKGIRPSVTIVGDGSERAATESRVRSWRLDPHVRFAGALTGRDLANCLREHRFLVVPSTAAEGYGIVAIEGIACGCAIIGSDGGGLPAAIGPCGTTFPNGDAEALATSIGAFVGQPDLLEQFQSKAEAHLAKHRPHIAVRQYLEMISVTGQPE